MSAQFPGYLAVPPEQLGRGAPVRIHIGGGIADIAQRMAEAILAVIEQARGEGRGATLIVPVGPVDQIPVLVKKINDTRIDCRDAMFINMDEYLDGGGQWVDIEHPLSFRGYMNRKFYDLIDPGLAPRSENRVFPDPRDPEAIQRTIDRRGGVDACFGGIGVNGHIAFNEPPEPGREISVDDFARLPTRTGVMP